eukprot:TRINITY_DN2147_c0_g1_i2.p1 TRINITY_DN2147_c0_g1~~TRINITY_DN2147_c0_g1_i2.p1  ORF type:complete len:897 (+),score=265.82 TRINITY_DN2147_c0_g1_i2:797-3487(+)
MTRTTFEQGQQEEDIVDGNVPEEHPELDILDGDTNCVDSAEVMEANNPALRTVQEALRRQLLAAKEHVMTRLREKEEEAKRAQREREDVGVELYGVQQQLARLQQTNTSLDEQRTVTLREREEKERDLQRASTELVEKKTLVERERQRVLHLRKDVDELHATLRQVKLHHQEQHSEIAVTKRATYKAEEDLVALEREKRHQDYLIDGLHQQLKRLREQVATFEAQIISQHKETDAARSTLNDAASEMEAIQFDKKKVLQEWQSTFLGMSRRDQALLEMKEAIRLQREKERVAQMEINGLKRSIKNEQDHNEQLTSTATKMENEAEYQRQQIQLALDARERLLGEFTLLKRSLDAADAELANDTTNAAALRKALEQAEKGFVKMQVDIQHLEEAICTNLGEQKTLKKSTQSSVTHAEKIRESVYDIEMKLAAVQNDYARIRLEAINTASHNEQQKDTLRECVDDLKKHEELISRYEVEIRRRHDEIEKKQSEVDRLNRKYDSLVSAFQDENTGPLEAMINSLQRDIGQLETESTELQRQWMMHQTQLLDMTAECNTLSDTTQNLQSELTVLNQKRMRIDASYNTRQREIKEFESGIQGLHKEMSNLNSLMARNSKLKETLLDVNFFMENDLAVKLKEMEEGTIRLKATIDDTRHEKSRLLNEIVEAERQVMLWERKIALLKETQAAVDPMYGQAELKAMAKEIHRMELRYNQLLREKQTIITDMEKAIERRETIALKGRSAVRSTTQALGRQTRINELQRSLRVLEREERAVCHAIDDMQDVIDQLKMNAVEGSTQYDALRRKEEEALQEVLHAGDKKEENLTTLLLYQRWAQRLNDAAERSGSKKKKNLEHVEEDLGTAEARVQSIQELLHRLAKEHPALSDDLRRIGRGIRLVCL